ncbi:hypothetical protein QC762_0080450 [Podospora pseudocomata]|uniref:Uncharacterized protein n=1 Tax=Podospora pseudocomata TaxID=2093779 RepID=A0ABR0GBJ4_9PEZI|nr:hypothetical protein QC762_0080450 [Podospora pseudocomata]
MAGAIMMVAYMGREGSVGARLDELANNCTVSCLVVYTSICATYLYFFRTLEDAKIYANTSESQAASYDLACVVLILFNGVGAFIEPFNIRKFIAAYISLPVFILLILCYNIRKHGFRFRDWWTDKSGDLSQTVQASSNTRKGRLEFPDSGITRHNWAVFVHWVWVWLK